MTFEMWFVRLVLLSALCNMITRKKKLCFLYGTFIVTFLFLDLLTQQFGFTKF